MPSDRKPSPTRLFWYLGCLVCLTVIGWGIGNDHIIVAAVGLPAFFVSVYLSLNKLVCSKCGKAIRSVGRTLPNCPHCGAPYGEANE